MNKKNTPFPLGLLVYIYIYQIFIRVVISCAIVITFAISFKILQLNMQVKPCFFSG